MYRHALQRLPLCFDAGLGVYYVAGEAPIAQGTYGSVSRCWRPTAGGLQPSIVKQIALSSGCRNMIEKEFERLLSVISIPGSVQVVQEPVYSATHGFVVTEYVLRICEGAEQHILKSVGTAKFLS